MHLQSLCLGVFVKEPFQDDEEEAGHYFPNVQTVPDEMVIT